MLQETSVVTAAACRAQDLQKVDCPWEIGGQIKQGSPRPKDARFHNYSGGGTANDPKVAWMGRISHLYWDMIEAQENLCRKIAHRAGQKSCVIRGPVHDTFFNKLTGEETDADDHITAYLGLHDDDLRPQDHIYVRTDEKGHPVDIKHPWQLKYVPEDREPRSLELFGVGSSLGYMYDVKPAERRSSNRLKQKASGKQLGSQLEFVPVSQ